VRFSSTSSCSLPRVLIVVMSLSILLSLSLIDDDSCVVTSRKRKIKGDENEICSGLFHPDAKADVVVVLVVGLGLATVKPLTEEIA